MSYDGIEILSLEGLIGGNMAGKCLFLCWFYRVFTHVRLGILEKRIFFYVWFIVEGMYTCNTGHYGNETLRICLCCCRGYVHMQDW